MNSPVSYLNGQSKDKYFQGLIKTVNAVLYGANSEMIQAIAEPSNTVRL